MSSKRRSSRIENIAVNNQSKRTNKEEFDVVDYLAEVKNVASSYEWTPDQLKALEASDVTVKHKKEAKHWRNPF